MKRKKAVTIYRAPSLFTYLFSGAVLIFLFFLVTQSSLLQHSVPQKAFSAESKVLYATNLLSLTPSPVPSLPFSSLLSEETFPASPSSLPAQPEDYCMQVPVLLYHHIQPLALAELLGHPQLTVDSNIFDEQMKYLVDHGYTVISAEDLVTALLNYQELPEKSVVVTIDDGYDDNYTYAFLTAKKYNIVINFMIPSALIEKPGYMTWDHLKEMAQNDFAKIYNHTATHAPLGLIAHEQIETELSSSSTAFKEHLGLENTIFTYPYGSFNDVAMEKLKAHGFTGAYSTIEGKEQCRSKVMTLQRMHIGNASLAIYGF